VKRIYLFSLGVVLLTIGPARADLIVEEHVPGQKVTLDTATGNYWYWNLEDFTDKDYDEQITAIEDLGTYGNVAGGWHMATESEIHALFSNDPQEVAGSFNYTHIFIWPGLTIYEWIGRCNYQPPTEPDYYYTYSVNADDEFGNGAYFEIDCKLGTSETCAIGAWVVSESALVPAPGALVLAATGLLSSTLGLKRLRRKLQEPGQI
jgi:hypothetical protein